MALQQFVNEPTRLQTVKLPDAGAKPLLCQFLDLAFIEIVFPNDLFDELSLLGRAGPRARIGPVAFAAGLGIVTPPIAIAGRVLHAICRGVGQIPDFLNFAVNGILCEEIEALDLPCDLSEIADLGLNADRTLVAAEVGQAQFF